MNQIRDAYPKQYLASIRCAAKTICGISCGRKVFVASIDPAIINRYPERVGDPLWDPDTDRQSIVLYIHALREPTYKALVALVGSAAQRKLLERTLEDQFGPQFSETPAFAQMKEDVIESGIEEVLEGLWLSIESLADTLNDQKTMYWEQIKSATIEDDRALRRSFEECRRRDWEFRSSRY